MGQDPSSKPGRTENAVLGRQDRWHKLARVTSSTDGSSVGMSESVTVLVASGSRTRNGVPGGWFRASSMCSCQHDRVSSLELLGDPSALLMVGEFEMLQDRLGV